MEQDSGSKTTTTKYVSQETFEYKVWTEEADQHQELGFVTEEVALDLPVLSDEDAIDFGIETEEVEIGSSEESGDASSDLDEEDRIRDAEHVIIYSEDSNSVEPYSDEQGIDDSSDDDAEAPNLVDSNDLRLQILALQSSLLWTQPRMVPQLNLTSQAPIVDDREEFIPSFTCTYEDIPHSLVCEDSPSSKSWSDDSSDEENMEDHGMTDPQPLDCLALGYCCSGEDEPQSDVKKYEKMSRRGNSKRDWNQSRSSWRKSLQRNRGRNNRQKNRNNERKFEDEKWPSSASSSRAGQSWAGGWLTGRTQNDEDESGFSSAQYHSSGASSSSNSEGRKVLEIPGFYYDHEQKQYFKILDKPGHSTTGAVTSSTIRAKETEKQRAWETSAFRNRPLHLPGCARKISTNFHTPGVMAQTQIRGISGYQMSLFTVRRQGANLQYRTDIDAVTSLERADRVAHVEEVFTNSSYSRLLCMWETVDRNSQIVQMMDIAKDTTDPEHPTLDLLPWGEQVEPVFDRITSVRMAPSDTIEDRIIYTLSDPSGVEKSYVRLKNMDETCNEREQVFELNYTTAWTCAWNYHKHNISVGSHKVALLLDIYRNHAVELFTYRSDPLAQVFMRADPYGLLSGTRNGMVLRHDLRCNSKSAPAQQWDHKRSMTHLDVLVTDSNYFLGSDISGEIRLYDIRHQSVVRTYDGLVNTHKRLPFHLDDTESIITSCGADSYTCMWDVNSGELLVRIPPPRPVTEGYSPRAVYSSMWSEGEIGSGLIMAMDSKFFVYQ